MYSKSIGEATAMEKHGIAQLSNTIERDLLEEFVQADVLDPKTVEIKNGKLVSIEINDEILDYIVNMKYNDHNIKRLLHLKSIKSIAFDYRYSLALSKYFLKNNDIVSAEVQFKAAHNLIEDKTQLQDFSKLLGLVYALFTKKIQKATEDFEKYKIKDLIQTKYPTYYSQLLEILDGNNFDEECIKKKKSKIMELFVKILLS